jgi:nucleoside-diphosphate-sugar epimerase
MARFIAWLADRNNPQNKNQAFNVTNGDLYRMEQLWTGIANYFGMEVQVTHDRTFNLKNFMTLPSATHTNPTTNTTSKEAPAW